ncbi:MAG: UDP-N-acetylmuramate dehydrogenase [Steroidobacteraceae bacterium]
MGARKEGGGYSIVENASLRGRNTFGVEARAATLVEAHEPAALTEVFGGVLPGAGPVLVLGEGSNVLLTRDWPGVVLTIATRGIEVLGDDGATARVRVQAGEHWNDFVHWSLGEGYSGLENLALIPGAVGAAPIQNIGAYGTEVREFIAEVETWDRETGGWVRLDNARCGFAYRDSIFKRTYDRYVVTAVTFALPRRHALRLDYAGVREELAAMGVSSPTPASLAAAIVRLRTRKLPDPAQVGNAGSFFKNPMVDDALAMALRGEHAGLPAWPAGAGKTKLSAAWLIERAGLKGLRDGDAGISDRHALVLVNHGRASGAQLWALAQRVRDTVRERFGVDLEPEPRIL